MIPGPTIVGSVGLEALDGELPGPAVLGDGPDDVVGGPSGDLGLDFEGDGDPGVDDAVEVGDDLLGDSSGVAAEACGVEGDGAVEPPGPGGFGWRRSRRHGPRPGSRSWARSRARRGRSAPACDLGAWSHNDVHLGGVGVELGAGDGVLDEQAGRVGVAQGDVLAASQAAVAAGGLVEAVGESEALLLPGQETGPVADGTDRDVGVLEAGEVDVAGEVVGELLDGEVAVIAPEGDRVEFHPEAGTGVGGDQGFVVPELLADPGGEGVVARGEAERLPLDGRLGRLPGGGQEPVVDLGDSRGDGAVGGDPLGLGLLGVEVEDELLGEDGLPGEVLPGGLVEVLSAGRVGGEEDERVAVGPRGVAARLEDGPGGGLGGAGGLLAVGVVDAEDDQAGVEVVGDVQAGLG
jgi:hypothetical protein